MISFFYAEPVNPRAFGGFFRVVKHDNGQDETVYPFIEDAPTASMIARDENLALSTPGSPLACFGCGGAATNRKGSTFLCFACRVGPEVARKVAALKAK